MPWASLWTSLAAAIRAASETPQGMLALLVLLCAAIGLYFFRKGPIWAQFFVFICFFLGAVVYGFIIAQTRPSIEPVGQEAYVFFNGDVSLIGGTKHFEQKQSLSFSMPDQYKGWSFDDTQYRPIESAPVGPVNNRYFIRCRPSSAKAYGSTLVVSASIANEWTNRQVKCHIGGYIRVFKS